MRGNQVHGDEPLDQGYLRVVENRTCRTREVLLAARAAETAVLSPVAMVLSAVRAYGILIFPDTPTRFDDCLLADVIVVEVLNESEEAVELCEIYHIPAVFLFTRQRYAGKTEYGNLLYV